MRIGAIIEARMSSSRFPGKVLEPIFDGKGSIALIINSLKSVSKIDDIVIATTTNQIDRALVKLANETEVKFFCGDEENVMLRVLEAGRENNFDIIVEITGDCPLCDPTLVEHLIEIFLNNDFDYLSNNNIPSYPDGFDIRIFKLSILEDSYKQCFKAQHFEHVTLHIRENIKRYRVCNFIAPLSCRRPEIALTLDEPADLDLIKIVANANLTKEDQYPNCKKIIEYLDRNTDLLKINSKVKRRGDT